MKVGHYVAVPHCLCVGVEVHPSTGGKVHWCVGVEVCWGASVEVWMCGQVLVRHFRQCTGVVVSPCCHIKHFT